MNRNFAGNHATAGLGGPEMSPKEPRELLTVKDVAAKLNISVSTVWRLVRKGELPAPIQIGGSTRWRRADLDALIAREAA